MDDKNKGMTSEQVKRYILTGTPGSGKTAAINELEKLGYAVVHESATEVIAKEQKQGIKHPWEQPDFVDQIISLQRDRQIKARGSLQFYDRSPFCTYALAKYLASCNDADFEPSIKLLDEINRCHRNNIYQHKVFFFENLGFIKNTEARKISFEDALMFEKIHLDVYHEFGFEIVKVPKATVKQRLYSTLIPKATL